MKNNRTKILLVTISVLIGLLAVTQLTKRPDKSKNLRSELILIDSAAISHIKITSGSSRAVELKRQGDQWTVRDGNLERKAVNSTVRSLFSALSTIKPSRLASRKADKWSEYQVDSAGMRIQLFEGENEKAHLILGKFEVEGQRSFMTYARVEGENETYIIDNFMKMSIYSSGEDYRNSMVLRLKADSLTQVSFTYPDSSLSLLKTDLGWSKGLSIADSITTQEYLRSLSFVSSRKFSENQPTGRPDFQAVFSFSNQPEIRISAYTDGSGGWVISSSENPDESFSDAEVFKKVFPPSSKF